MPTFVLQSVIPLLFMLSLPWLDRRKVLIAWPFTHLPDIDYILEPHRAAGHNLFILLPILAVGIFAWRTARLELAEYMVVAGIYVASHIVMDIFAGGVTLLYPLSLHTTCYYAQIRVVTATNDPFLEAGRCSYDGIPVVAEVYTWLPSSEAALLVFLVPAALAAIAWGLLRRKQPA